MSPDLLDQARRAQAPTPALDALADALNQRPDLIEARTDAEFEEIIQRSNLRQFRIVRMDVGTGTKWRWRFELRWPDEQQTLPIVPVEQ